MILSLLDFILSKYIEDFKFVIDRILSLLDFINLIVIGDFKFVSDRSLSLLYFILSYSQEFNLSILGICKGGF